MKEWVQCFYNCHYNQGSNNGQSKYIYGFMWIKLIGDTTHISEQIIEKANLDKSEVFNFQVNQLTPFPQLTFEENPNI